MATYINDLRVTELATGEASGSWGTTTNVNLELLAEAMGVGAEAIANASTHTITMADGATDQFRSTFLRLTGGGQACTVTLAPNTISHTWIMRNETAAALTLTQGSGANVIIAAGQTKIVATDGGGSGGIVYEMDDLELAGNLAVGGTLGVTGIATFTDDIIIGDGKTIGSASDVDAMTIASNGQVTFTQTLIGTALDISGDIDVDGTANLDVVDIDGAVDMASTLTVAGVLTGASLDISGDIDVDGTSNLDVVDIDGAVDMATTLNVVGSITSQAVATIDIGATGGNVLVLDKDSGANIVLQTAGTTTGNITTTAARLDLGGANYQAFSILNAAPNNSLTLDGSGNLLLGTTASGSEGLNLSNGFNLGFSEGTNSSLVNLFRQTSSGSTFLGSGYRYSDTANKAESSYASAWARSAITVGYADVEFFVDAEATVAVGTDITPTKRVTIGVNGMGIGQTDSTSGALTIQANSGAGGIAIVGRASGGIGGIGFYDDNGTTGVGYIQGRADDAQLRFWGQQSNGTVSIGQNNTERLQITATGLVYSSVQYIGGFGAQTTSGTTNFNDASNALSGNGFTLLRGDATNGPGGTAYYHVFNYEYVSKNGTGNMTQLAYGYNDNKAYMRYRLSGSWSAWAALH